MKKNIRNIIKYILLVPFLFQFISCEDPLEEKVYSQLAPGNYLNTEEGIKAALNGVYDQFFNRWHYRYRMYMDIFEAGYGYNEEGSFEARYAEIHEQFLWTETDNQAADNWNDYYNIIREANIVLDNLEKGDFNESLVNDIKPEALALRGYAYAQLYRYYGPTPIFVSSEPEEEKKARASEDEMLNRIESDLSDAIAGLPPEQDEFGRITKGGALAILCKHYLNTKQWQKTVETADQIINLDIYSLQPNYQDIFAYDNERNSELILTIPCDVNNASDNANMGLGIPKDYPLKPNQNTWAARLYAYDKFMDSFAENDERDDDIILEYVNTFGDTVKGYGNDKSLLMFKYGPDPNAVSVSGGLDIPVIRYADILMSKAEALNELNGPNQESIDLINMIRDRAGVDPVALADFASKTELRDHIFQERMWEFYYERKSREDMIRHGTFISSAQERGLNAKDYHRLYPIPQSEVQANPNIEQNPGY